MGPDVIVFFEPNIDCDLSLFDAVERCCQTNENSHQIAGAA